jgi:hypothetical protein
MVKSEKKTETTKKYEKKNSLVENINAKKKAETSNPKSKSTVSDENYHEMQTNWKENQ